MKYNCFRNIVRLQLVVTYDMGLVRVRPTVVKANWTTFSLIQINTTKFTLTSHHHNGDLCSVINPSVTDLQPLGLGYAGVGYGCIR